MLQFVGFVLALAFLVIGFLLITKRTPHTIRFLTKTKDSSELRDELVMVLHPIAGTVCVVVGMVLLILTKQTL